MQLAVIGLGTMGANLARNAARNGARVPVYNRTTKKTEAFINEFGTEGDFVACNTYSELIDALKPPRAILIMVKSGPAVDAVINDLTPLLSKADILIDGGNSHYPDTERRAKALAELGINFIGMGVSGGEDGALNGPSLMPGSEAQAYASLEPLLKLMSADDGAGGKCVANIGPGGAGHFVKMVHNGIEYGVMQLIAESYDIFKNVGNFSNQELAETYQAWSEEDFLGSFLIEITAQVFKKDDDLGNDGQLIDYIADQAGQKGTGKWTTQAALDYGVAIPTINAAVDARIISGATDLRKYAQANWHVAVDEHDPVPPKLQLRSIVRAALNQSTILAYKQGFNLIEQASQEHSWGIDLAEVARIWRGGCIIRSKILSWYQDIFSNGKDRSQAAKEQILPRFRDERQLDWRRTVEIGSSRGIPLPAMSTSLAYYDALKRERLPQSIIQAQRDLFGAHTFERIDKKGSFHANWMDQ